MKAVRRERYICIQEFMVRDLGLKGNELIVYALLYGFTQDGEQYFSGSLNYIANWINASKSTAQSVIKSLLGKGCLVKRDNFVNNVKFCEYRTAIPEDAGDEKPDTVPDSGMGRTENRYGGVPDSGMGRTENRYGGVPDSGMGRTENRYGGVPDSGMGRTENRYGGVPDSGMGRTENRYGGVPDSGTNNNIYNTNNNLDNNKYILSGTPDGTSGSAPGSMPEKPYKPKTKKTKDKTHPEEVRQIIDYFNRVCGTDYKYQSKATADMVNARLNDGFTVEDFCKVIDTKYAEWVNNPDMCKYIRPQTLFRPSHFENYLNQRSTPEDGGAGGISAECRRLYNSVVIE